MEFAKLCEKSNLHGLAFQHHAICQRRAWFHLNRLDYAHLEDRMKLGVLAHETSKVRDRSVYGLMGLSPDRIDWQNRVVIEAKAKGGVADAVSRQAIYYALILSAHTGKSWIPAVYVISERRTRKIQIREEVISEMLDAAKELTLLLEESCPKGINAPICRTCSYALLCGRV
ncbi:MAG: Dna2/Cas4 domain-containing protein [Gammaproteobacteria bacterium]|nr:Dna2/Cas4 domain-containing protein [Gammaproteobacteria bacterium]